MAETDVQVEAEQPQSAESGLEHGTYEVIRNRLRGAARSLRTRLDKLNAARKDVFGAIETKLLATERVTTGNNCVPRDMTPVGDCFLFGYNVHIGLKSTTSLEDVFSIYAFRDRTFAEQSLELIEDERFRRDFAELFRYYKKTVFARFAVIGPHLYMVFRVSEDVKDIKAFK
ncbi:MAG: DNA repair ATPase, partial [Candidatus Nealsonbacteria bacterium]|nr:DNA repair ATPase [Candidatus Nealsonbacteria bacterium]